MIFGSLDIDDQAVQTHRDSYLIAGLSVISVRRPFLPVCLVIAAGTGGFGIGYFDLLWPLERLGIVATFATALMFGWKLGQLQLLSRDLRGSELAGAIYGTYGHLNRFRQEIVAAKRRRGVETSA